MNAAMIPVEGTNLRSEIESYLERNGWHRGRPGVSGELWSYTQATEERRIAVPYEIGSESREFQAIAMRLSQKEHRPLLEVVDDLEREFLDVQSYRIADSFVNEESVLLDSAATVLTSARRLIRAAATTSRRPRAYIGSNFSAPGDEIARKARLSHTRRGSFVLPVVLPIEKPEVLLGHQILDTTADVQLESSERRVTRTLASALAALHSIAIEPAKEANQASLVGLVESGVSRELVSAVRAIASDGGVHAFDAEFRWAPGVGQPGGLLGKIIIPADASSLLSRLEKRLLQAKPRIDESISGQIVEIRHLPGEPSGEIAVRTVRGTRTAEVRIRASGVVIRDATDWFKAGRAIRAQGVLVTTPGRPLAMPDPRVVSPLDQLYLNSFADESA
jgi:hypothetical protein